MWPSSESTWNTVDLFEVKSQQVKKKKKSTKSKKYQRAYFEISENLGENLKVKYLSFSIDIFSSIFPFIKKCGNKLDSEKCTFNTIKCPHSTSSPVAQKQPLLWMFLVFANIFINNIKYRAVF